MTALCTQLLGQTGGLGGLYLPTTQQPSYAARFDAGNPSDNLALGGSPAIVFGSPVVTSGGPGVLPSIALQTLNTPKQYVDTGVLDTASLTVVLAAKFSALNTDGDWGSTPVLVSNFANNETGTLQFVQMGGGIQLSVSTATSGISNIGASAALTSDQAKAWGLYAARIRTTSAGTALTVQALTAGTSGTFSSPAARYISPSVKTLQLGSTPAGIFGAPVSLSEPLLFPYALTDDELAAVVRIIRARAAAFGVTL